MVHRSQTVCTELLPISTLFLILTANRVNEFHTYWGQWVAVDIAGLSRDPPSLRTPGPGYLYDIPGIHLSLSLSSSHCSSPPASDLYYGTDGETIRLAIPGPPQVGPSDYASGADLLVPSPTAA